ncbi:tetratricopeptide repeat protein [Capillimicrobium parvum]|uniref:Tetratricopeptide repeat protein n=1 Tax=Capillimicrobium parvum TaxID=2884022 RepID=A0A9E6Y2J1_9ACTN|nr:hypothetical protein [Capillimicrobium parvum]UGS38681.1 hypothetical protein DSM104329_05111 [Capillimicrobium parvum]
MSIPAIEDTVAEFDRLSRETRDVDRLLEGLREVFRAKRELKTGVGVADGIGPAGFRVLSSAAIPLSDRKRIAEALQHVLGDSGSYSIVIDRKMRALDREASYGKHADPFLVHELETLRQRLWLHELCASTTDTAQLWQLDDALKEADDDESRLVVLRRLLDLHPNTRTLNALGAAYRRTGQLDAAQLVLTASVQLDGAVASNVAAHTALVALDRRRGDTASLQRAHRNGRKLVEARPDDSYCLAALAGVEISLEHPIEAEQLLARATALEPTLHVVTSHMRDLVALYQRLGRFEDADRLRRLLAAS